MAASSNQIVAGGGIQLATDPLTGKATGIVDPAGGVIPVNVMTGVATPVGFPTQAAGAAGVLTGLYNWAVTFLLDDGTETDTFTGSPVQTSLSSQQGVLTNIPVSLSSRVVGRKIYRSVANPSDTRIVKYLTTINDNTTTNYTDNAADGTLGADLPSVNMGGLYFKVSGLRVANLNGNSIAYGQGAFATGTGYANTAIGVNALAANTSGLRNVAIGTQALKANTTGIRNTVIGVDALIVNTVNGDQVAIGFAALTNSVNAASIPNTAVGSYSMNTFNSSGNGGNSAFGYQTMQFTTTGYNNTAIGNAAMYGCLTGADNVAVGYNALKNNTNGNFNTAIGMQSQENATSGSGNVSIGFQSLSATSTASQSVAIGQYAGKYATAGNEFYINNQDRTNTAGDKSLSLMYGVMAATAAAQSLAINAVLAPLITTVAGLPAAAAGNKGFKAMVTDAISATPAFCSTTVGQGSGSAVVPVFSDGTIWRFG